MFFVAAATVVSIKKCITLGEITETNQLTSIFRGRTDGNIKKVAMLAWVGDVRGRYALTLIFFFSFNGGWPAINYRRKTLLRVFLNSHLSRAGWGSRRSNAFIDVILRS